MLLILLPLVTSPYISRVFGADGLGVYSYYYSVANYFLILGMLGISNYGNRGVAAARDNQEKLSIFFSEVYLFQLITMATVSVAYAVYLIFFCKENIEIALIMYLYLASGIFDISWLFFGLEKFKITVTRNIIIKVSTVLCMFIFVHKPSHVARYSIIMCGGMLLSQVYLWKYVRQYVSFRFVNIRDILKHTKSIFILFVPVLSYSIYKIMDKIILGNLSTFAQVGLYANAEKATNIPIGVITAFGTVMLPRMSNLIANGEKAQGLRYTKLSIKFITFVACAISFGLIGISDVFSPVFFGPGYEGCSILIKLLAFSVLFTSWTNVVRTQYLIPNHIDNAYVISTVIGAVLNLIINLMLISSLEAMGVVIGTVVAEFSMMFTQMFWVRKKMNFFQAILHESGYVIIGALMAVSISVVGMHMENNVINLCILILAGAFIYIVLSIVMMKIRKDELYGLIVKTIKGFKISVRKKD